MHRACLPFIRPSEPSFVRKLKYRFDVPVDHMSDRYKKIGVELANRYAEEESNQDSAIKAMSVKSVKLPDITHLKQIQRDVQFSIFTEKHIATAVDLIKIFDECETMDDLLSVALYVRDEVNSGLFVYAYSVALSHRTDSKVQLPSLLQTFPSNFVKKETIVSAREEGFLVPHGMRKPIEVPLERTSSKLNPEHALAYFREDIGINLHHWHWHLVFPTRGPTPKYYDKDRRGELFHYMHHQMLNRYNASRLTEGIPIVDAFNDYRQIIADGYYPKMTTETSQRNIPPRQDEVYWKDLKRSEDDVVLTVTDVERWRERIFNAIDKGHAVDASGKKVFLNNLAGIDVLANMVESNALSINGAFYGNLHGSGHIMTAFCHDPESEYNEGTAVMGSTTTAVRDPFFFRWHSFIDDLFLRHKETLPPYSNDELKYDNVHITEIEFISTETDATTTELKTFWQKTDVNISNGLDFQASGPTYVRFTHLNYEPFSYRISVNNKDQMARMGTVRIFFIAINNQASQPYKFNGSRRIAIELDRFVVNLKPGANRILRKASESALTIPFEQTFPPLTVDEDGELLSPEAESTAKDNRCACGWPQHHLLPKGNESGFAYRVFVMISDFTQDEVKQPQIKDVCKEAVIFCGVRDQKYPDARAMGYPFDRPATGNVVEFADFLKDHENMLATSITIRHIDKILKHVSADNLNVAKTPSTETLPQSKQ